MATTAATLTVQDWSVRELEVVHVLFTRARLRDQERLIKELRQKMNLIDQIDEVWQLHDYLSIRRHQFEGKSQFKLESILFDLAEFLRDGLLKDSDLEELAPGKQAKIRSLAHMGF
jgi:hypothetical protein